MEDIIGFNDQIGAMPFSRLIKRSAVKPAARPAARPVARPAARPVARPAARPVAQATRAAAVVRPAARPVAPATRAAAVVRPAAKPAQIRLKKTSPFMPAKRVMPKQAVIKPTGQVIPVKALTKTTNPTAVTAATPVQRSFMPVDLPYQKLQPTSKPMKLVNTPYTLTTNINLIEPAVDPGIQNYYGK